MNHQPRGQVLITSGATREPIDGIRYLSNVSTGQTGARLANELSAQGWEVTYLHGAGAALPTAKTKNITFGSFQELDGELRTRLQSGTFNGVVHAAAVSDYSIASVNDQAADDRIKLKSDVQLTLQLRKNFKILPRLKEYSSAKGVKIIGFKLTLNDDAPRIARGMIDTNVDAVVANDWSEVNKDRSRHPGVFIEAGRERDFTDLNQLANFIHELIIGENHGPNP